MVHVIDGKFPNTYLYPAKIHKYRRPRNLFRPEKQNEILYVVGPGLLKVMMTSCNNHLTGNFCVQWIHLDTFCERYYYGKKNNPKSNNGAGQQSFMICQETLKGVIEVNDNKNACYQGYEVFLTHPQLFKES